MRSNSGKDESRNNLRDPTIRDRQLGRDIDKPASGSRKPGETKFPHQIDGELEKGPHR
jgi:hypothetical protein